jgi:hypothetical protein
MRRSRSSHLVSVRLLAVFCFIAVTSVACQGGLSIPTAPSGTAVGTLASTAARPSEVCRGGPGGFPCWTPGDPPPTGPQQPTLINYDEAVSGDLSENQPFDFLGSVGVGENTIIGTTFASSDASGFSVDIDSFSFDVPAGLAVTRIVFEWNLAATGSVNLAATSYDLQSNENSLGGLVTVDLLSSTPPFTEVTEASGSQELFPPALPLGPGSYDIVNSLFGLGGSGPGPRSWTANYTWTITAE